MEQGYDIVAPIPSCVLMFKQELPLMFPQDADVQRVKARVFDPFEYLMLRHRAGLLRTDFKAAQLGKVSYHVPCHLRVQNIGLKTRDVLRLVPGTTVDVIERCSGHDGTYAVKSEFRDAAVKIGAPGGAESGKRRGGLLLERLPDGGASDRKRACRARARTHAAACGCCASPTESSMAALLTAADLLSLEQYARERAAIRARMIGYRATRRLQLGPDCTWSFEDRETVRYQVQEMLRTERIFEPAGIAEELAAYNPADTGRPQSQGHVADRVSRPGGARSAPQRVARHRGPFVVADRRARCGVCNRR